MPSRISLKFHFQFRNKMSCFLPLQKINFHLFWQNCCLQLQYTSVYFAEIEKLFSRLTQHTDSLKLTFF
jgi:hypothetical protein